MMGLPCRYCGVPADSVGDLLCVGGGGYGGGLGEGLLGEGAGHNLHWTSAVLVSLVLV